MMLYLFSPPNFQWNSQILNESVPNRTRKVTPQPVPTPPKPLRNPSHSSQRSPPRPFWALPISCAKLLICLVTSQCFLHRTEGEISTLFGAVNHSAPPLVHWYHHYSIRLYSNSPTFLVITVKSLQGVHDHFMAGIFFFPFNSIPFNYKNKQKSYLAVTTHFFYILLFCKKSKAQVVSINWKCAFLYYSSS